MKNQWSISLKTLYKIWTFFQMWCRLERSFHTINFQMAIQELRIRQEVRIDS